MCPMLYLCVNEDGTNPYRLKTGKVYSASIVTTRWTQPASSGRRYPKKNRCPVSDPFNPVILANTWDGTEKIFPSCATNVLQPFG